MLAEPDRQWRIITSDYHSTVWDGRNTLFEFNWQAFGEPPEDCFDAAFDTELPSGKYMEADFAPRCRDQDTEVTETDVRQDLATTILTEGSAV